VTALRIDPWPPRVITAGISGALNEPNMRYAWEPLEILHREYARPVDESMDEQFVCLRVDLWDAGMMSLKMESGRSDDAV
jgi:hypothetical protein